MVANFKFKTADDVLKLVELAEALPFEVYVEQGHIYINAKSLIALYTLIDHNLTLVAPDSADPEVFANFLKQLKKA